MAWDDDLLPEQRHAAGYVGSDARLLAGPGTGKTRSLTKRICFLIEAQDIEPNEICALTFTRAAAHELRQRVEAEVGGEQSPQIATLHSFALRQLLRNSDKLAALPQPLRIADDWEERWIILEDLKSLLALGEIDEARNLLNELSADWQTLTADEADWDVRFPNPAFLGAWREHRDIYGYVLRAELVYQLKRALEQYEAFSLEGPPEHLLVDEYQDLNRCDLAVVKAIGEMGAEVYVAGDDDQSIYGFRKAHPEGIRRFPQDYPGSQELALEVCKRCDAEILELGLFVARQDYARLDKPLRADDDRIGGEIALLRFQDQDSEARGAARICRHLIDNRGVNPDQILVLLRADGNRAFSSLLRRELENRDVPVGVATADADPLADEDGRQVLSIARLLANENDHLSWRTLLKLRTNGVGSGAITAIYDLAKRNGVSFNTALQTIRDYPSVVSSRFGGRIQREINTVLAIIQELAPLLPGEEAEDAARELEGVIGEIILRITADADRRTAIQDEFDAIIQVAEPNSIGELVRAIEVSRQDIEQEVEEGKVNILTMHKGKGLTAKAVIIVAAEDEYLPGRAEGDAVGDERRLLYVSLTRAMHHLFITYCTNRTGQQRHTGRTSGRTARTLTRFLQDAPVAPRPGNPFVLRLGEERD